VNAPSLALQRCGRTRSGCLAGSQSEETEDVDKEADESQGSESCGVAARQEWRSANRAIREEYEQALADVKMEEQAAAKSEEKEFRRKISTMSPAEFEKFKRENGFNGY
jgi:hypothetical protein